MKQENADTESMSFLEHLDQLRATLLWIGGTLLLLFVPALFLADRIQNLLIRVSFPTGLQLQFFSPVEPFMVQLKIALFTAALVGAPPIFWKLWQFIKPALYGSEQRWIIRLTAICSLLFVLGAVMALLIAVPLMMRFALSFQTEQLKPMIGLENFVSLAGWMMLGFGTMFQLPVAIYLLAAGNIVSVTTFRKQRPLVVVGIVTAGAILMPDVVSQLTLSIPAWLMFEISLLLAAWTLNHRADTANDETVVQPEPTATTEESIPSNGAPISDNPPVIPEPVAGTNRYQRPYGETRPPHRLRFGGSGRRGRRQ